MKKFITGIIFLNIFVGYLNAQNKVIEIVEQYARQDNYDLPDMLPKEDVIKLVSLGDTYIGEMIAIFEEKKVLGDLANVITALGFLGNEEDKRLIEFLESKAYTTNYFQLRSIEALFRIGGEPLERFIKFLFSKDDFSFQQKVLNVTWISSKLSDLLLIEAALDDVLLKHPDWKINNYIINNYIKKFDFALSVSQNNESHTFQEELKQIFQNQKPYFNSVPGGISVAWGLKKLVNITPVQQHEELIKYLRNNLEYKYLEYFPRDYILFQLYLLNQKMLPDEIASLLQADKIYATETIFPVFRTSEELLQYYEFRQSLSIYKR